MLFLQSYAGGGLGGIYAPARIFWAAAPPTLAHHAAPNQAYVGKAVAPRRAAHLPTLQESVLLIGLELAEGLIEAL